MCAEDTFLPVISFLALWIPSEPHRPSTLDGATPDGLCGRPGVFVCVQQRGLSCSWRAASKARCVCVPSVILDEVPKEDALKFQEELAKVGKSCVCVSLCVCIYVYVCVCVCVCLLLFLMKYLKKTP